MDETTAHALDVLYESSLEIGRVLDEAQQRLDLHHRALSALHDLAVEEHSLAMVHHLLRSEWRTEGDDADARADDHMGRDPA